MTAKPQIMSPQAGRRHLAPTATGAARTPLVMGGALIALAFWAVAWVEPEPGEPAHMATMGVAIAGYVWALRGLAANALLTWPVLLLCFALGLAWRVPLIRLPPAPAADAVRYIWDARVVSAGLDPYRARPDDPALQALHSDVTREVDAAWLPTIYPPVAQLYFLIVTAVHESITAFRVAALVCDAAIVVVLARVLRVTGQPVGWALLYAWHPLLPLEGALSAHLDFAGVLALVLSWLALIHRRPTAAALTFAAAVLIKPLPLVLAPLYWRRIQLRDALLAAAVAGVPTAWIARGGLPLGSTGAFVDEFRFNGPLFAMLEHTASPHAIAAAAVLAGLGAAVYMRRTRAADAPEAWAWPMALALIAAPVIYPWYLVWLIPFALGRRSIPIWVWTLSVLAILPTWHLWRLGGPFAVPPALLFIEFALPAIAWAAARRLRDPGAAAGVHG